MSLKNLNLKKVREASTFRKMAIGTWKSAADPSVYGLLEINMTKAQVFIERIESEEGVRLTPAHLVGKAIAVALKKRPELNGMIRGSRLYLREFVTLFYQVNIPGGKDGVEKANLSGITIEKAENKSVIEISEELRERAQKVREGRDEVLKKNMNLFKFIPWFLTRWYLNLGSFLMYGLNLNMTWAGLPRDPFGSVMITNIGSLGVDKAWAPLVPYSRVPLLIAVGKVSDQVVAENGVPVVRPLLPLCVTFDHRFIDGAQAAAIASEIKECFRNPQDYLL